MVRFKCISLLFFSQVSRCTQQQGPQQAIDLRLTITSFPSRICLLTSARKKERCSRYLFSNQINTIRRGPRCRNGESAEQAQQHSSTLNSPCLISTNKHSSAFNFRFFATSTASWDSGRCKWQRNH